MNRVVNHGKNEINNSKMEWIWCWNPESQMPENAKKRTLRLIKPFINGSFHLQSNFLSLLCFPSKLFCVTFGTVVSFIKLEKVKKLRRVLRKEGRRTSKEKRCNGIIRTPEKRKMNLIRKKRD